MTVTGPLQGDLLATLFIKPIQSTREKQTHNQYSQPGLLALQKRNPKAWRTYPPSTRTVHLSF